MKFNRKLRVILILIIICSVLTVFSIKKGLTEFEMPSSDTVWSESNIFSNVQYQTQQREDLRAQYSAFGNTHSIDTPYVVLNPYDLNPLSAYIAFDNDEPVSYRYEVVDSENGLNFEYSSSEFTKQTIIPVIGLFENRENQVDITITNKAGGVKTTRVPISTGAATYNPVKIKNYGDLDEEIASGWYFDPFYNGFDTAGNIRFNLNVGVEDNYMKFTDESLFVKVDNYQTIYELNMMGEILNEYKTPSAEYNFHHDIVKASNGKVYALGSYNVDLENVPYAESFIFEYDKPGKPSRIIDLYEQFDENKVSLFGTPNKNDPIHINSIDYIEAENELIVSSQAQSFIAGINVASEEVDWVIQDDNLAVENKDKLLTIVDDEGNFEHTSGQHTAFLTNNSKYDDFRGNRKYVISVFNNNNCKDDEGNLLYREYSEAPTPELCTYDQSDVLVYGIDLNEKTVTNLDQIVIDGEYAPIMSAVFDVTGDNFLIHFNKGGTPTSYLTNSEGEPILKFDIKYDGNGYYRANFKTKADIDKLVSGVIGGNGE